MFKVSARTVLELGSELISSDIIAFYELIKNGFDAGSPNGVEINFQVLLRKNAYLSLVANAGRAASADSLKDLIREAFNTDAPDELEKQAERLLESARTKAQVVETLEKVYALSHIIVSDSGSGMSSVDLEKNFLVLGTPSRKREVEAALKSGSAKSPYLGEKGIGRLSAMRLGNRLRVETARNTDSRLNILEVDWHSFEKLDAMIEDITVEPTKGGPKASATWSGTRIIISDLSEDWTATRVRDMAGFEFARLTDPFLDQKSRPRIAIFWNDERQTIAWMEQSLLKHAHARVSGTYEVEKGKPRLTIDLEATDLGFKHPPEKESITLELPDLESVVAGTSQLINDGALASVGPFTFEAHWYNRRRLGAIDGIGEMKVVRELQQKWSGISLFRDGFRVFPYGDDDDDWLALDRKALGRGGYALNKTQFVGRVSISRTANPDLVDQTNREGLRVTPEQQVLLTVLQHVINQQLFNFIRSVEKQYKQQKVDITQAKSEIVQLEERAKSALKQLRKIAPPEGKTALEDLQQTIFDFTEIADRAHQRISEVEVESRQMVEMAGVGLMVEVVAHELARASENALENLEALRRKGVPQEIQAALDSLRAQMKSLSKRVRILDSLSVAGRQRTETFLLEELIVNTLEAHENQFKRHKIRVQLDLPKKSIRIKAVKGMIVQILENLISNSKYWMEMRKDREPGYEPMISLAAHDNPPTIIYEDNGRGIAPENREKVFRAFFSLKEKSKRRGLGLYIARECARYNGGTLTLEEKRDSQSGRLHRFTLELPADTSV